MFEGCPQLSLRCLKTSKKSILVPTCSYLKYFAVTWVTWLNNVHSVCMIGVTLYSSLSLNKHVANTVASCNFYIRALRHICSSLTPQAAVMIACSLVNTRLDYCNLLLVNNTNHNIIRLQRVQNNLARVILCKNRRTSADQLFHEHDIHCLRINEINIS